MFVRRFCFARKGLNFCYVLPTYCTAREVSLLWNPFFPSAPSFQVQSIQHALLWLFHHELISQQRAVNQLPNSLLPSWCQLEQVAEGLMPMRFVYPQGLSFQHLSGKLLPVFDLFKVKAFFLILSQDFPCVAAYVCCFSLFTVHLWGKLSCVFSALCH